MMRSKMSSATYFKVRGKGQFPLDMLRYDECYPVTPVDVEYIESRKRVDGKTVAREVSLATHKRFAPTEGRWESFGWTVFWDHS